MSQRLAIARRLAADYDLRLFPLREGVKLPAIKGWQDAATTDEKQLEKWFGRGRRNIGVATGPSGLIVVDCDRKEEDGDANLRAIAGEHVADLDATLSVNSPSGGRHYYFKGQVRDSVGKLGKAIDIRSKGGLVAGVGSTNADGKPYTVHNRAPIADAPEWLLRAITEAYVKSEKVELKAAVELDTQTALAFAADYLDEAPPAIEGQGGNDRTYKTAAHLKDIGISEFMAGSLMLGSWNDRCVPPWDEDELLEVVSHAYQYGENSPGSASVEFEFEEIPDDIAEQIGGEVEEKAPRADRFRLLTQDQCAAEAATVRPYIVKGVVARRDFGAIIGKPGAGKSLMAPYLGHRIARGEDAFGRKTKKGTVLYVAVEDADGMKQRVTALRDTYETAPGFFLATGFSNLLDKDERKALIATVKDVRPDVIFIDTLARAFPGIDENTTEGMSDVVQTCRGLSKGGAAVIIIHHNTKAGGDSARGSGLLDGDLDMRILVEQDAGYVKATLGKNRNGSHEWSPLFQIAARDVGRDEDGDPITAAYVKEVESNGRQRERLPKAMRGALEFLRELDLGDGASYDDWKDACTRNPSAMSGSEDLESRLRVFRRVSSDLIERKLVIVENGVARLPGNAGEFEEIDDPPFEELET